MTEENINGTDNPAGALPEPTADMAALLAEREGEIAALKDKTTALETQLFTAIDGYRELLLSRHPEIAPEMINGQSIAALHESLARARRLMAKLKENILLELAQNRVPAGAPGRLPADLSGLSPREKISYGIGGKQ